MHTKFVIVGSARTGTSFITDSLLSHPDVLMHGEPFQMENLDWHIRAEVRDKVDLSLRERDPVAFIHHLYSLNSGRPFVGAKILHGQNDIAQEAVCQDAAFRKILLRRTNLLAVFSSYLLAEQTGMWNFQWEIDRSGVKINFDAARFRDFVSWQQRREARMLGLAASGPERWLMISYSPEQMAERLDQAVTFLGLDRARMTLSELKRMNTAVTIDRFENPGDVEAALQAIGHPEWSRE